MSQYKSDDHMLLIRLWSRMPELIVLRNDLESVRKRRSCIRSIAKQLRRSETETKIKMTLLRTIYSNEIRKYNSSLSSGMEVYTITWPYYKPLSFLSRVYDQPNGYKPTYAAEESESRSQLNVKLEHEEVDISDDELHIDYQEDDASNEDSTAASSRQSISAADAFQGNPADLWTSKQIYELIDFWRDSPIFYDKKAKSRGGVRTKRSQLLHTFSQKINKDVEEVKSKMKNLKANFLQEVKKYRSSLKAGKPDSVRYTKWQYFVPLSFLAPDFDVPPAPNAESDTDASMSNQSYSNRGKRQSASSEVSYRSDPDVPERLSRRHSETFKLQDPHEPIRLPAKSAVDDREGSFVTEANSECAESVSKRCRLEDETDMFCAHIAAELKQLPANVRRTLKFRIQQMVFEAQVQADQASALASS